MARITTLILAAWLGLAPLAMAEKLNIADQPASGMAVPTNGMSMDQVKAKFGAPNDELPAVGDPPITRWIYDGFTVYYEYNLVIHSVLHHKKGQAGEAAAGPSGDTQGSDDGPLFLMK